MKLISRFTTVKERIILGVLLIITILQVLLETAVPAQMETITTLLQTDGTELSDIMQAGALMCLYAVLALICAILTGYILARVCSEVCSAIKKAIFKRVIGFSMQETGRYGSGALITRSTKDVTSIENFIKNCVIPMIQAPLYAIIVIIRISGGSTIWTVLTIASIVLILALVIYVFAAVLPLVREASRLNDRFSTRTKEHVSGIRVIHAYNAMNKQKREYEELNDELTQRNIRQEKLLAMFSPTASAVLYALSVAIYFSGAYIIEDCSEAEKVSMYSGMVAYVSYISMLIVAFVNLITVIMMFPSMNVASKRITEVLETEDSIRDGEGVTVDPENKGSVEFKHVSYRYEGAENNVLTDINFKIESGSTVAIIGGTGCGKTTLLNLIPRLLDATEGEIIIDGENIRDYKLKDLRDRIGYVPQCSFLFGGTISGNIAYGEKSDFQAAMEDVVEASRIGMAEEFIQSKEKGYDSEVVSGGRNFSGGQRQRLSISRAICRNPEIYIFDDSFSALDFKTDKELRKRLKEHAGGNTMIIVGQRIGTIMDADNILVMDGGRIVGQGRHEELMRDCEVYRQIALSQLSEEEVGR